MRSPPAGTIRLAARRPLTMRLGGRLPHIGIVSDRMTVDGHPYVLHNIGLGTQEEDILGQFEDERRFRYDVTA
ncbi:MAG: DUF1287 domain-containing protein [Hyphomonas sp.]